MSFSRDAKTEAALSEIGGADMCRAELSGLIRSCGELKLIGGKFNLELISEIHELFARTEKLTKALYGNAFSLTLAQEERPNKPKRFIIGFPQEKTEQVLIDSYAAKCNSEGGLELLNGLSRGLFTGEDASRGFIKGAFIGCASANIVIKDINELSKHTGGYHLEFVFNNAYLSSDFSHLLSEFGIYSKTMKRKGLSVVYVKEAELVSDLLALVGANNAVLTLQNEFAVREVRNKLNRQLNCMNANLNKMVDASLRQLESIKYIDETVGIETLPENLYELCMLRLANPEETLDSLAKLMSVPLTKSGINHRLRKIVKIADELKRKSE